MNVVTTSTIDAPKAEKSARSKLYRLHAWLGFHLAFLMSLVLFTGTFATISNEIDWLIQADMRVSPQGQRISWGELETIAQNYHPGHTISSISHMKSDYFAYRARMIDDYGRGYFLHINQWTGEVTGTSHPLTVQRFFRDIHRYLFMPNFIGLPIVTSLAFILAISLYTGLKTTRKWGVAATRIRFHKKARVAVGDAHRMAGIWGSWFFIVIIVTGIWYLAEFGSYIVQSPFEPERPGVTDERLQSYGSVVRYADADTLIKAAKTAYPELEPRVIFYPFNAKGAVTVLGRNNDFLIRDRANRVFLDPVDASLIKVQRAENISWAAYLNEVADPLHFGYFGGLTTKLIWFAFGLAMTGLSISGVWLTWKRLKAVTVSRAQFATLPVLIAMMIFGAMWYDRQQGPDKPETEKFLTQLSVAGFNNTLALALNNDNKPSGLVRFLSTTPEGRPNLKAVSFTLDNTGSKVEKKVRQLRRLAEVRAQFDATELAAAQTLTAKMIFHNGETLTTVWRL